MSTSPRFRGFIERCYRIVCGQCACASDFGGSKLLDLDNAGSKSRAVLVAHAAGWRYESKREGRGWVCPSCLTREADARSEVST